MSIRIFAWFCGSVAVAIACQPIEAFGQQQYYFSPVYSQPNQNVVPAQGIRYAVHPNVVSGHYHAPGGIVAPVTLPAPPATVTSTKTEAVDRSRIVANISPTHKTPFAISSLPTNKAANPESETISAMPGTIGELMAIEKRIDKVLPKILPAVVSIEGGSGVIVSADGIVLTVSHVTKKAHRVVKVRLQDGRTVSALTMGTNLNSDTAALKITDPGPWPFVSIGDSTLVKTGDWCLALGYPLSFQRGKPSAVRVGRVLGRSKGRLVTDCPIMGGDSGGPLVNLNGTLIGISSRVKNDINQNLHVPVQRYQDEWPQLSASVDITKETPGTNQTAYLGILGETDIDRVRIRRVHQGSPAAIAGLLENDVILQLDGKPIEKFDDVIAVLQARKPGEQVVAKLNRFGSLMNVAIRLGPNARGTN